MSIQQLPTTTTRKQSIRLPRLLLPSLFGGLVLGRLALHLWPRLPPLAALAMWILGVAAAMIVAALVHYRLRREPLWELAILGQLLGVIGTALLAVASLG